MTRVVLTGSEGSVGRILTGRSLVEGDRPQLNAEILRLDMTDDRGDSQHSFVQSDLEDHDQIKELLSSHDAFIHAAWNTDEGILKPNHCDPNNVETALRILECAIELGKQITSKIVLLSTVNTHVPEDWRDRRDNGNYISVNESPRPNQHNRNDKPGLGATRYGQSKILIETAARLASEKGLHVIAPRLGSLNLRNIQSSSYQVHQKIYQDVDLGRHFDAQPGGWEDAVRLKHTDLVSSLQNNVAEPYRPGTFDVYNLVSDSPDRVHVIK